MGVQEIVVDWDLNSVARHTVVIRISEQEKIILREMLEHKNQLLDRKSLMEAVWGKRAIYTNDLYLTQLVSRLRRSVAPLGLAPNIITAARRGYKYIDRDLAGPESGNEGEQLAHTRLVMDQDNLLVSNGSISVRVTRLEGRILAMFIEHPDMIISRETLISGIWQDSQRPYIENLTQLISKARKIVHPLSGGDIKAIPNVGYKYCAIKGR